MSDIKMVRLSSGEEIICKWSTNSTSEGNVHVLKDCAILFPMGQGKLAFAKWMPYLSEQAHKDGIKINEKFVMFVVDLDEEMKNQYQGMISGLVVPSAGPIIGSDSGLKLST